jgi:malate synthase
MESFVASVQSLVDGVEFRGELKPGFAEILTPEAIAFVADLQRRFGSARAERLKAREETQKRLDQGWRPDFLEETKEIRESDWTVAPLPEDLLDRRVEITGPTDRKMVINALNSGASLFMADFEDSNAPNWDNMVGGQVNMRDAVHRTITFNDPVTDRHYALNDKTAVLKVRPRGWHLPENHMIVDGEPCSGSIFDFGLFFFHNAREQIDRGTGPYFYLPKMEHHLEVRLWNDVFNAAQDALEIPRGTIKATILIETILAAFQMDEFLWEIKDHSAGLNCGRWDYIFSFIKRFRNDPTFVLPDRALVTMTSHFLESYSLLLIKTCHRRNVHAMGGMAAQIPIRGDEKANAEALEKVYQDKLREVKNGHDGTWVAHPGLIATAKSVFDEHMPGANQIDNKREDVNVTADDLLAVPDGPITEAGFRQNINVGMLYTEAWLRGNGCVPLYNLMEDAATAEISRTQLWQWVQYGAERDDGATIDAKLFEDTQAEEVAKIKHGMNDGARAAAVDAAADLFRKMVLTEEFSEFLTLPAYDWIVEHGG